MDIDSQSNKISVLMSVYNDEKRVSKSIESILNQTFQDFEFLILDDCSTDNTYEICNYYAKKNQKIKLMKNHQNLGLTKSLNLLISESNYELIARQDSDDESFKQRLEIQLKIMEKHNLDACTTLATIDELKGTRPFLSHLFPKKLIIKYKNPFIHGSLLIKKRVLENVGMYDEKFKFAQDYKLMFDLIRLNHKLKIINQPLYKLNLKDNISTRNIKEQNYYANCVKKEIDP
tara:strand:- start:340 stop:1035 length:696 start_codon:yes stop_codon:yes gene_type:complete